MSDTEILDPARMKRGYAFKLVTATAAASIASGAFWVANNERVATPVVWQAGAALGLVVAGALTLGAIKSARRLGRMRAIARAFDAAGRDDDGAESRARMSDVAAKMVETLRRSAAKPEGEAPAKEKPRDPIEVERERLRKAGFTDAEISQILIARESGGSGGFGGQGLLSGVLSNVTALVGHVRDMVPSVKTDLANMFDREADAASRVGGTLSLTLKGAAVIAFGYFAYLEALQLRGHAYKAWAEACIERQKNAINFSPVSELGGDHFKQLERECGGEWRDR